ncbi:MAG TPA: chitinase [Candidatus Saccharimonadales bacterium]|jgi:chitinase
MKQRIRQFLTPKVLTAVAVVAVVGGIGAYLLASSNAQAPAPVRPNVSTQLIKPVSLGLAPYQYIAYSGSIDKTRQDTGIKQYFAAFIIGTEGCIPTWGGNAVNGAQSARWAEIAADFTALRAAGGDVTVSFGGSDGNELASVCKDVPSLTAAYRDVITAYRAKRIDFDIEGPALTDVAGNTRRVAAIQALRREMPDLQVWVTLPVDSRGLTAPGLRIIEQLRDRRVVLNGINIMTMNYNIGSRDLGKLSVSTASAVHAQLQQIYPTNASADLWKVMGVTVMIGRNNTLPETFQLADAPEVREFVVQKGIGTLSYWNAGRDTACADPKAPQPDVACSGLAQQPYEFLRALTIPALP